VRRATCIQLYEMQWLPSRFLQRVKRKVRDSCSTTNNGVRREKSVVRNVVTLLFFEGTTERLKRALEKHDVNVSMKPVSSLKDYLKKPKHRLPTGQKNRSHGHFINSLVSLRKLIV